MSLEGTVWYFSPVESIVEMFLGRVCFFPPNISRSALGGGGDKIKSPYDCYSVKIIFCIVPTWDYVEKAYRRF